jgi:hypothetical protein
MSPIFIPVRSLFAMLCSGGASIFSVNNVHMHQKPPCDGSTLKGRIWINPAEPCRCQRGAPIRPSIQTQRGQGCWQNIVTCMSVTIEEVWVGDSIYWWLTGRNFK